MFINKGYGDVVSITDTPCELLVLFIIWEAKWAFSDILACDISTGWFWTQQRILAALAEIFISPSYMSYIMLTLLITYPC